MSFVAHERIPLSGSLSKFALSGGMLARALDNDQGRYVRLEVLDLFSPDRPVPSWILRPPCAFVDFTMDRGQDLLALVNHQR